jgi:hypothetical protein
MFSRYDTCDTEIGFCKMADTMCSQIEVCIALNRYYLDNKVLPQMLDLLVPKYLAAVPKDPSIGYSTDGKTFRLFHVSVADSSNEAQVMKGEGKQ